MSSAPAPLPQLAPISPGHHGEARGAGVLRQSSQLEGRFGRMFRTLPPAQFGDDILMQLGALMTAKDEGEPTPETQADDEENTGISAGYTYLGQFIDHDLTFDPASSLQQQNDPDALVDYRTPRFDLDNVYGRGPDDQPYLYRDDGVHMLLGDALTGSDSDPNARGIPRHNPEPGSGEPERGVIGDPRNDENVIVSQLQASMLRFHNRMADFLGGSFEEAQRMVRFHYQWVVLYDFLPTIIGQKTLSEIFPHLSLKTNIIHDPPQLKFYKAEKEGYIPIEFSVAAYRFGHSMVRPVYRLNANIPRFPIFSADPNTSLTGFRRFPSQWAIDWSLFFDFGGAPALGPKRVQPAYKIDTSLVNPLGNLPFAKDLPSLAQRNLLRGKRMNLPSGQTVAASMGIDIIPDENLYVCKANDESMGKGKKPLTLAGISPLFENNAPLWYYILAEAQQQFQDDSTPICLGPVGGRIVGEVFVGLMMADHNSVLRQDPLFKPLEEFRSASGKFKMADLLQQAMQA